LDGRVREFSANQALGVKDGVFGVEGYLILGGIANQAFRVPEINARES
jgi:hypothetical protein